MDNESGSKKKEPNVRCDHKAVIILDHSARFAEDSNSDIPISLKNSNNVMQPVAVAKKSIWTWAVESVLEFHRIIGDLFFDSDRLLRIIVVDSEVKPLQPHWDKGLLSYDELISDFTSVVAPNMDGDDCVPLAGIVSAVEALGEMSTQQDMFLHSKNGSRDTLHNGGSIVIFCRLKNKGELELLQKAVADQVYTWNANLIKEPHKHKLPIEKVNLYVASTYPRGAPDICRFVQDRIRRSPLMPESDRELLMTCRTETVIAGQSLTHVIRAFCLDIYDLVSTTVSGIPMKEEAQQGTSVNYDVELIHPKVSHASLEKLGMCGKDGFLREKVKNFYATYKLAWSTPSPKNRWNLFPRTMSAMRVTPSSVNSRPSVCLTSFLMAGRNVMLELKREGPAKDIRPNVGQKLISHTLISHEGRIYIHAIDILYSVSVKQLPDDKLFKWPTLVGDNCDSDDDDDEDFEPACTTVTKTLDFDDISEEIPEGTVADGTLRTEDLCELIRSCFLRPREENEQIPKDIEKVPCGQAIKHIRQLTRYWPTIKEDSLIFQTTKFNDIINIFRKTKLEPADMEAGKKAIGRAYALKNTKEPLLKGTITCHLLDDPKNKEEQYKVAFVELASYVSNYLSYSDNHKELFNQLMETFELDQHITVNIDDVPLGYDEIPSCDNFIIEKSSAPPTAQSSRSSSPVPKKVKKIGQNEPINIFELLCSLQPKIPSRPDFVGREEAGKEAAKLYKNIDFSNAPARGQEVPM